MFTKNIFLTACIFSNLMFADNKNDQFITYINRDDAKDFAAGFGLGIAHGVINKAATNLMTKEFDKNAFYFGTFVSSNLLDRQYNKHYYPKSEGSTASAWGHAFGQILGDSIDLSDPTATPKLRVNLTLIFVSLFSLAKDIKKLYN